MNYVNPYYRFVKKTPIVARGIVCAVQPNPPENPRTFMIETVNLDPQTSKSAIEFFTSLTVHDTIYSKFWLAIKILP